MRLSTTLFLKFVIILLGLAVIVFCVFGLFPWINSDDIGYYRPILVGMLVPGIPFFIALVQAFKLLGYIEQDKAFSNLSVYVLKNIKYCALTIAALYAAGTPYVFYVAQKDDAPGVVAIAGVVIFASLVIATFAAVLQKLLKEALDIKSENELTV